MNRISRGGVRCLFFALSLALIVGLAGCGAQTAAPAPGTAGASPADGQTLSCTLSISCAAALSSDSLPEEQLNVLPKDGWIYAAKTVSCPQGETVLTLLRETAKAAGIPVDVSSGNMAYVRGIDNLYEKDCGDLSGWLFKVNREIPSVSAADFILKDGDTVEWVYSCDLGRDMGWS